jgi:uncharacterized protein YdcH (DUF465 family)
MKDPNEYTIDEVAIWLGCIGLGEKVAPFRENAIDGAMLVTLSKEDLTGDLGLSNLQTKKVLNSLESTKQITGSGGGDTTELQAEVDTLKQENEKLKAEITSLKAPKQVAPAPAPAPAPKQAPPPKKQHTVVRGAATGAAGGAMKGAIVGAILPGMDASDGAKAGAAVGATKGGLRGLRARR